MERVPCGRGRIAAAVLAVVLAGCTSTWEGLSRDASNLFGDDEEASEESAAERPAAAAVAPPSILEVQRLLDEQGYDPGPVDGIFGDRTARAIRSFEANNGMPVTGKPSAGLLRRLRETAGEQAGTAGDDAPWGDDAP